MALEAGWITTEVGRQPWVVDLAAVMFAAIVLYAVFGGADFGSGMWDLLVTGNRHSGRIRRLIDHAIGPVWEANHVWLIFVLVFLWTGFPSPFGVIMRELSVPMWLAGLGILLRAFEFAMRKYAPTFAMARAAGSIFALSSVVTPFFLGSVAGAIASGRVDPADITTGAAALSLTSVVGGVLATLTCAFLAGVFLAAEADRLTAGDAGWADVATLPARRSLIVGAPTGIAALLAIYPLLIDTPTLSEQLTGRAGPLVVVSGLAGAATLWLLATGRLRVARSTAAVAVGAIVVGWGVAQYPWILVDHVTIEEAAGHRTTLIGLLATTALAAVLVVPAPVYLYRLADTNQVGDHV